MDGRGTLINKPNSWKHSIPTPQHGSKSSCPYMTNHMHMLSMLTVVLDSLRPTTLSPQSSIPPQAFPPLYPPQTRTSEVHYCSAVQRAQKNAQCDQAAGKLIWVEIAGYNTVSWTPPSINHMNSPFAWCGVFASSKLLFSLHFPPPLRWQQQQGRYRGRTSTACACNMYDAPG